ncbi:MAG: sugar phosphate isomerase/epimerase [Chloroflexota bacterium]|nr:sugar phosphate isomerase/epimerase [Chloroflexota bacterium]
MQLLCYSGTFSRYPDRTEHEAILRYGPRLQVAGIEVMFYPQWHDNLDAITTDLLATGLRFPVLHAEKDISRGLPSLEQSDVQAALETFEINCRFASQIGASVIVLHLWGMPESDSFIERNMAALPRCLDIAERNNVTLAIETVPCTRANPLTHIRFALQADPRCTVTLDTEFLEMHNQLEAALQADWLWRDNRAVHIHIKDYDRQPSHPDGRRRYLHPGEGRIDFSHFFRALQEIGYSGTISLEAPVFDAKDNVDIVRLDTSLRNLRSLTDKTTLPIDVP